MAGKITINTGQIAEISGIYHPSGAKEDITLVEGKRVPPNKEGVRQKFTLVKKTSHERKK